LAVTVAAFATGAAIGPAGAASPPSTTTTPADSAVSQYVEKIPTAHGSAPSSAKASKSVASVKDKDVQRATVASSSQLGMGALIAIVLGGIAATAAAALVVRRRRR
jgi:subtilase family serine protease